MSWAAVAVVTTVASTALSAYSSYQNNKAAGKQAEADADAARAQGRVEAERIRKEKERQQSAARAALAQNGLNVGEGTAVTINDTIERDAGYDAAMSEIAGFNASQRLQAEASVHRKNANTAAITTPLNSFSSGVNTYKGWK